ncbi:MAG: hydroxyacid dehydrogenase [Verrucomicrobiota bacterium JB022]|nr:hydroxyacid dehydrogenase [Verrucomicrobiota bacterium JB022]
MERLQTLLDFDPSCLPECYPIPEETLLDQPAGATVALSTWGCAPLTENVLERHPDLKLIIHGAGSIHKFHTPEVTQRGIVVCSAVHLNAQPVAEFCLGVILASLKDLYGWKEKLKQEGTPDGWRKLVLGFSGGYYKTKIGLIGFGEITKYLLTLLQKFDFDVYVASQYFSKTDERRFRARSASLEWIMSNCKVVSLHSASTPKTRHMINADNLKLLQPGAILINTARGAIICEEDLAARLNQGDITAYLDVTDPEPPALDHPFYQLPNCYLTPHVSGSISNEVTRLGDYVLREVENFLSNHPQENSLDLASIALRA